MINNEFLEIYTKLDEIDIGKICMIDNRNIMGQFLWVKDSIMNYIKSIFKSFFEVKYSYAKLKYLSNKEFKKDNKIFGDDFGMVLQIGPTNKNTLIDPILSDNKQVKYEWISGYYINVAILRSYSIFDMSATLLNFLLEYRKLKNVKRPRTPYLHNIKDHINEDEEQLSSKFKYIPELRECIEDACNKFYDRKTKGKQIYNSIKHNLDTFIELNSSCERYNFRDMEKLIYELYQFIIKYIDVLTEFIVKNINVFLPEAPRPGDYKNACGEKLERLANIDKNPGEQMGDYLPDMVNLYQK